MIQQYSKQRGNLLEGVHPSEWQRGLSKDARRIVKTGMTAATPE